MAFPETHWSMLAAASAHGDEAARIAMNELCQRYWQPVYAVVRSLGSEQEDARDRTQSFFLYLLDSATLRKADKRRGRFRTFLMTVLWRFLRDERKREAADKRGGDREPVTWDEEGEEVPAFWAEPGELLDREWALSTMERAIETVRREFIRARGDTAWSVWRGFLPGSVSVPSITAAASILNLSEAGARTEIHRLRNRCREALRRELMATVSSPEELEEELAYLGRALHGLAISGTSSHQQRPMGSPVENECRLS